MNHYKKVIQVIMLAAVILAATVAIGADQGALTEDSVGRLRKTFEMDARAKAMYNAITNNDVSSLALNRDIVRQHNEVFSHKIKAKGVTNQKKSGRCWLFAGLNVLRPAVIKKHNLEDFEFSQAHLQFWDKLEKANCFYERIIELRDRDIMDREIEFLLRKPLPDGGYWENVVDLISKYGVAPKDVMQETNSSENTALMNTVVSQKLRADAARLRQMHEQGRSLRRLRRAKTEMLGEVYGMLAMNLGEPPTQFQWRFEDQNDVVSELRTYTPQSFFQDFVAVDLGQYVDLFNDPAKEYGKHYEIRFTKNVHGGDNVHFVNVPIDQLKATALKAVLNDQPVWFGADVGKDQSRDHGIMAIDMYEYEAIYGVDLTIDKATRALYRGSVPNHAMVLLGVDMHEDKPVKWLVENSWGKDKGSEGLWTLYDSWFDKNVYSVIVRREFVPDETLDAFEQPAILLPPWDPMYGFVQ